MRILFCNFEYPPLGGGGGFFNKLIAEELAKRHEVTLLTSKGFDLLSDEVINRVRILRVPTLFRQQKASATMISMMAYVLSGLHYGRKLVKKTPFDIINTHFVLPTGLLGAALAKIAKIPNVLSVHGGDLYDPSKLSSPHRHYVLRLCVRQLLRSASCVVGQSQNTIDNVSHFYDDNLETIRIPLGIQRPPSDISLRENYHFKKEDFLLVTIGRLVSRKAIDQLISMMKHLQHAHLLIIGTGPLEDTLKKKAEDLQVQKQVHFLGQVSEEEKFKLLRMSDLFVSTSIHEGFGLIFLEAMASGLPVICYDNGGQTDFLKSGQTGYLIKLNDQKAFLESCQKLIRDKATRKSFGKNNIEIVENYFIENCAEKYEHLFQKIIEENQ